MKVQSAAGLLDLVREAVGSDFHVTGDEFLIEAGEDERHGGRSDDERRARDIQRALGDDTVAAIVLLRGGAWFTRVLQRLDLSPLERRTRPVAVFGFSELTTLVNIVAASPNGIGIYDMGPAFLTYGLKRFAQTESQPGHWMRERLHSEFRAFFQDIVAMIEGRGTRRRTTATLVRGSIPDRTEAVFVGGNLTVLSTLIGSRFEDCIRPSGRWLVLEDVNEKLERIDRFLAHLTLARMWQECAGILLGNFHKGYDDLTPGVLELLEYHVPADRPVPVLLTSQVGHVWPMSPLPLHIPGWIERISGCDFAIGWEAEALQTVATRR